MIGSPKIRVDGPEKVSGTAKYALEYKVDSPLYAVPVKSTINRGSVASINVDEVEELPGVVKVIHAGNAMKLKSFKNAPPYVLVGQKRAPLQDKQVDYIGQDVALVLAETLEDAIWAGRQLKVEYSQEQGDGNIYDLKGKTVKPEQGMLQFEMGAFAEAKNNSSTSVEATYTIPSEHHNPMEISNCIALWDGDRLTVYDATQGVNNYQACTAWCFETDPKNVRVISKYIGGGFGCKGSYWSHTVLAAIAAKMLDRPVKINLSREDMFTSAGHRPRTLQNITITGDQDGKVTGIQHKTNSYTNIEQKYFESCGNLTRVLYDIPNMSVSHEYKPLNLPSPVYMRAPGEAPGSFALESAMDEYAAKIKMDPIEFRLKNYAEVCPFDKKPWSLKKLRECYAKGAEIFGWDQRKQEPKNNMRDGKLIGYGMATSTYPANRAGGAVRLVMDAKGILTVQTAVQDIGTGTWTVMGQIAADAMGISSEMVNMELGDTDFPQGFVSGGSNLTATAGSYIIIAVKKFKEKLLQLSIAQEKSPHYQSSVEDLSIQEGMVESINGNKEKIGEIIKRSGKDTYDFTDKSQVGKGGFGYNKDAPYSSHSFGVIFAEVEIDPDLGVITVPRLTGVFDVGKIMNSKTGKSQLYGGMVWGYGMALLEKTDYNPEGRVVNADLAEYHVPVNADIRELTVDYIDEPDYNFSEHGGRGIGEIGIVGTAAAIANAVYNATGKRVRDLPITMDKLI
ncbi:MAG TPA: xanthine dehydrogenase family protein molybdopterin-binding subunit [Leeuwenhoekiella sp.]|nr:xanthine dehydrogenase family protein molybdopterin-binding subunit [Leeuwenhoekiella sp.]